MCIFGGCASMQSNTMQKALLKILPIALVLYMMACGLLFVFQEKLIFFPQKLDNAYQFNFDHPFREINISTHDGILLNGLLFTADSSKGLIFYLHGNAGSLSRWGEVAKTYTDMRYDVFILDYRGYGKSQGSISGQLQLFQDIQTVYDKLKEAYAENNIIVLGYSIGTGLASRIASTNNPRMLILQAPYFSMTDLMRRMYPIIPTFILKYKFATNEYIKACKMPIVIFHGNDDKVIYYGSSLKLKTHFKPADTLITLNGQGHNGITYNEVYKIELQKILNK